MAFGWDGPSKRGLLYYVRVMGIQKYFSYFRAVNKKKLEFRWRPPTCHIHWQTLGHKVVFNKISTDEGLHNLHFFCQVAHNGNLGW